MKIAKKNSTAAVSYGSSYISMLLASAADGLNTMGPLRMSEDCVVSLKYPVSLDMESAHRGVREAECTSPGF